MIIHLQAKEQKVEPALTALSLFYIAVAKRNKFTLISGGLITAHKFANACIRSLAQ